MSKRPRSKRPQTTTTSTADRPPKPAQTVEVAPFDSTRAPDDSKTTATPPMRAGDGDLVPVVSVSPHRVTNAPEAREGTGERETPSDGGPSGPTDTAIALANPTPSGAPSDAPNEVNDLQLLLEDARLMSRRLALRLTEARRLEREPTEAARNLDERLVLGARMLKAFEVQIARAEATIATMDQQREGLERCGAELEQTLRDRAKSLGEVLETAARTRLDDTCAAIDTASAEAVTALDDHARELPDVEASAQRIEATARDAVDRIVRHTEAATARFDERAAAHAEAVGRVDELEQRLDETRAATTDRIESVVRERDEHGERLDERLMTLDQRIEALAQVVETAEVASCAGTRRTTQIGEALEAREAEVAGLAARCEAMERHIEHRLAEASSEVETLRERSAISEATMEAKLLSGAATAERLARASEHAANAAARLEAQPEITARLERLLERLAPWERLLLDSDRAPDGTPRPVASMVDCLRTEIGQNMAELSATMHGLARRVDELIPAPARAETPAESPPEARHPRGESNATLRLSPDCA